MKLSGLAAELDAAAGNVHRAAQLLRQAATKADMENAAARVRHAAGIVNRLARELKR
jgi:hypothetical protein